MPTYTPPVYNAVNANFTTAYTAPTYNAANAEFLSYVIWLFFSTQ